VLETRANVVITVAAAAVADWIDDIGKSFDEPRRWSFVDILAEPAMICVYVVVGLIALISSILLWKHARRLVANWH